MELRMGEPVTASTLVRCLSYGLIRRLADHIDPQEGWRRLAMDITNPSGEGRYSQMHIRRFEAFVQMGKSPTCELLFDWGTTNCTVADLVDLLIRNQFLAPASLLLPEPVRMPQEVTLPLSSQETFPIHEKQLPVQEKEAASVKPVLAQSTEKQHSDPSCLSQKNSSSQSSNTDFHNFLFHDLESITNNFDARPESSGGNKLGEGGFGIVFKGYINGRNVAVKKLVAMVDVSVQDLKQQFEQEINLMAKCQHENLVELLGFSSDGAQPCLVYEYMPNGSLLDRLACLVLLEIITGLPPVDENREPQLLLSIKDEIEDEEATIEDYVDEKMSDWDVPSVHKMYSIADRCLNDKKNRRPDIKMVQQHLQEIKT
ncbi:interleukin-1 receptor-associated kinase 4 isoform X3 [Myiozetetes cayanensis]|uniref:interleukin-1 receptor-associated kinase 4 isoform X3 n=1 Tax=Myiozetetes cayanensis TaxID=478635 RepID=UPI00215FB04D|nr:interleukin-1 receptor-associated kinase 4 isoform X3 [Myiozetetes cayanensis]